MNQVNGVIICLSYILGLLLTAIPGGGLWVLILGILAAVLRRHYPLRRKHFQIKEKLLAKNQVVANISQSFPCSKTWLVAGLVGLLASGYFYLRVPQPGKDDISGFVATESNSNREQLVMVRGKVLSSPRLTRSQRGQFVLEAKQVDEVKNDQSPATVMKGVTGKLYVTVPILQATGLYPGQQIAVTGNLYKPKAALNPGGFDFQKYLQQDGIFAGLLGKQVKTFDQKKPWGWWQVRERIVRSQIRLLGIPEGPLVSAMVLGGKAVDLPYDIRDVFVKVGLAHTLAASGFQTSLILGIVLRLTKNFKKGIQITFGGLSLILFLCLTGLQPSVLRAVIMGFAALIALAMERKVKQLGSLLLAATLLLVFNPLWIWDLGFQLSFLATLGLITTASAISRRLDWLLPVISESISVPLAATIWTLPIILASFSVVSTYCLPLNIITTPLVSIISLGSMATALASLILPDLGSYLSSFLYYPTYWLIQLVEFTSNLPGSSVAVGAISIWQMLIIYSLIILTWLVNWWQKRWWLSLLLTVALVLVPAWQTANNLLRITVLAAGAEPVIVVQNRGTITLINSGNEGTGRFTILPFLQQQGVNTIDSAIASKFSPNQNDAWLEILQSLPIKSFYEYSPQTAENPQETRAINQALQTHQGSYQAIILGQTIETDAVKAQFVNAQLPILKLQIFDQNWLLVGNVQSQEISELVKNTDLSNIQVLWCRPESLQHLVSKLKPKVAIVAPGKVDNNILSAINQEQTKLFLISEDGAVQWTHEGDFTAFIQTTENKASTF
ncbi:MAG TPA: ComEC/Rec2 family competence protein [Nostocaceae cyanobacterium]|nr:ComEC/Rec2 family competence protein [Nostocaceae cyanobacterium]